jgi:hypothetical protein
MANPDMEAERPEGFSFRQPPLSKRQQEMMPAAAPQPALTERQRGKQPVPAPKAKSSTMKRIPRAHAGPSKLGKRHGRGSEDEEDVDKVRFESEVPSRRIKRRAQAPPPPSAAERSLRLLGRPMDLVMREAPPAPKGMFPDMYANLHVGETVETPEDLSTLKKIEMLDGDVALTNNLKTFFTTTGRQEFLTEARLLLLNQKRRLLVDQAEKEAREDAAEA